MIWAGSVYRGSFNGISKSSNVQVFGKDKNGKLVVPIDLVLDSLAPVFVGAPVMDASSQVQVGTIDSYDLATPGVVKPFITITPTVNIASVPIAYIATPPALTGQVSVKVVRGGLVSGLIITTGTLVYNELQFLPFPNLGSSNQPAYIADFDGVLNDPSNGSRVLLDDNSLFGMLYTTDSRPGAITRCRIYPAFLIN